MKEFIDRGIDGFQKSIFFEEQVGSRVKCFKGRMFIAARRENNHRYVRVFIGCLHHAAYLYTVNVGQHDVEHHHHGPMFLKHAQDRYAAIHSAHVKAAGGQSVCQKVRYIRIVFNDENFTGAGYIYFFYILHTQRVPLASCSLMNTGLLNYCLWAISLLGAVLVRLTLSPEDDMRYETLSDYLAQEFVEGLGVSMADRVVTLTLDWPPGNRITLRLLERVERLLKIITADEGIRAVVLQARGADFSFGADLNDKDFTDRLISGEEGRLYVAKLGRRVVDLWASLPMPSIVAARGRVIGAGACFFIATDFKFAAPQTRLQFPEVDRGMHLSWGTVPRLVQEFGWPLARRMALLGEWTPVEQLPPQAVQSVVEPEAAARELALKFAEKPPLAVRSIKSILCRSSVIDSAIDDQDAMLFSTTVMSQDFSEALAAWFGKRPGQYYGK